VTERCVFVKDEQGKFVLPPQPKAGVIEERLSEFRDRISELVVPCAPISDIDFVNMYRGPKRQVYEKARLSLLEKPLEPRDAEVDVFIKYEKIMKEDAVPRAIMPRSPRFNLSVGKYLKPIEEKIFDCIDKVYGHKTVMKGMNVNEIGACIYEKWQQFDHPVAVSLDAHRFDAHTRAEMLRFKHSVEQLYYRCPEFQRMLEMQIVNVFRARCREGSFSVKIDGGVMSGDIDTSLGDVIIACAMLYALMEYLGIPTVACDNGDDMIAFMERRHLKRFLSVYEQYFLDFGYHMALDGVAHKMEDIVFCQMTPVAIGGSYRMVRTMRRMLLRDSVSLQPLDNRKAMVTWLNAVGECGLALSSGIPVYQALYDRLANIKGGSKSSKIRSERNFDGKAMYSVGMESRVQPVSDESRVSFWEAFGVCPTTQTMLEKEVSRLELSYDVDVFLDNPIFDLF